MKQVIVVRGDLEMSIGKVAAQACHASVAAAFAGRHEDVSRWLEQGQTKVVLQAPSLEALLALQERCRSLDLCHELISDAGRTELPQGTLTALGIGPAECRLIDTVTGYLPLLK
jgi:peptidyl-tRNA hydrolase, PTH2 family